MTDTPPESDSSASASDEDVNGSVAGQKLANARRSNDISIAEVALALHLDEHKVQALEENQFDALGAPVFAKGHLRKYAELVGVEMDDILADYYKLHRSDGAPPVVGPKRESQKNLSLGPWIVGVVAVAIIGGTVTWWMNREPVIESTATPGELAPYASTSTAEVGEQQLEEDVDDEPANPDNDGDATVSEQLELPAAQSQQTAADETASGPAVTTAEVVNPAPTAVAVGDASAPGKTESATTTDDNQITVVMAFSGDCWTEVTDANGDRMFFGLGQADRTVTRRGVAPFQALFGDRNNVLVTVNGSDFPLTGGNRRGNTARVTLDAPQN